MRQILITPTELRELLKEVVSEAIGNQGGQSPNNTDSKEFMNFKEACVFLNLTESTLYSYTSRRSIPFIKRTRKLLFRRTDLIKWLNSGHIDSLSNYKKSMLK